ncbi:MAG TPA: hypothetical protein DCZ94_12495 [Lentisphaeria bacterium]|nr:MAG: hypothetical protein A2X48_21185 [Lentisphaerae bacterium GWF2_49_21]HBC87766.1 hypothetical protein [Lentisphaeria bacterium]
MTGFSAGAFTAGAGANSGWAAIGGCAAGAGIIGLSRTTSWLSQPLIRPRIPIAIAEMTAAHKTFMRLFFAVKPPVFL